MFMFDAPWFALLLPVPLLVLFLAPEAKKNLPVLFYPHLARLKASFKETTLAKSRFFSWQTMLFYVLWISLVGALMGPQLVDKYSHTKSYGYDLMLAVDISQSMEALDFSTKVSRVSRLDATKEVVSDFVKGRQGDRVGLVLFGEFAHLQIPLTQDTLSVGKMLENAESGMAGGATAIGDAIGLAVKNLRERPEGSRILILLTDGENNAGSIPPIEAAKLAKEYGIRIYTIGMGSTGAVPFPNRYGQIVMANVSLDEPLLKEISSITGGSYFRATNTSLLGDVYKKIDALTKSEAETKEYLIQTPLFHIPLGLALLLFLVIAVSPLVVRRQNAS